MESGSNSQRKDELPVAEKLGSASTKVCDLRSVTSSGPSLRFSPGGSDETI